MLMYSALHIMQWFSGCLDVFTPKIRQKFVILHSYESKQNNVAYTRLEVIARTKQCCTTYCLVQRQTDLLLCTISLLSPVNSSSKHGCRRSSLLLYSIFMV